MKILITGGAGFIGSHIADYFVKKEDEVVILDNLSSGKKENVPEDADLIIGSVTNLKDVEKAVKGADYVFHLAALVSVPLSIEHPKACYDINVKGTKNILQESLKAGVKKVIFPSSASIYGVNLNMPLKEDEPYNPLSPYAESKAEGEKLCLEYSKKGLKTCILRYFNVYGPRQDARSPYSGVITLFMGMAKNNEDILIYGNGKQTRDFIHISDIVKANVLAMEKLEGIYNVAAGDETSINEIAEKIIKLTNSKSNIKFKDSRKGDIAKSVADISRIKKEGFAIETDLNKGLKTLLD
jgi:UDP-glucose 4-epimerase